MAPWLTVAKLIFLSQVLAICILNVPVNRSDDMSVLVLHTWLGRFRTNLLVRISSAQSASFAASMSVLGAANMKVSNISSSYSSG